MKNIKKWLGFFLFALLLAIGAHSAQASELAFSVKPILPENQVDQTSSYYNLLLKPNQTQKLDVELSNQTEQPVLVDIAIASATTNLNGVVEYSPNKIQPDASLKYNLVDYTKVPSKVELAPKTKKTIQIEVTMPNHPFDGVISGGITFKQEEGKTKEEKKNKGISIQNQYQFVVGLLMQQNKTVVSPDLQMNQVEAAQVNFRNVVNANFQNIARGYLKDMAVDAEVVAQGQSNPLFQAQKTGMSMAPNSNFDFPMPLSGQRFKPGKYTYQATVYGLKAAKGTYVYGKDEKGNPQHYTYRWTFTKDFEITGQKASTLNAKDVTVKPDYQWIYWLVGALIFVLFSLVAFILLLLKRRKKEISEKNSPSTED
ncbi:MAG: DUF916 and DUF3324 domain-containing protein [Streptococcaceae bacterium]|nr:DUF916 and DUF3324 domain-containing protein [Streptococcaceae bacterium]